MAIWQFEVALQPNKIGGDHLAAGRRPPESGQARLFERDDEDVLRAVDEILPRRNSWSKDLVLWGEESGNRVHAVLEAGKIAEVTARIDLRQIDDAFIAKIIEIARECDAHLQTADEQDVPAEKDRLLAAIQASESFRYVRDPQRYFGGLPSTRSE